MYGPTAKTAGQDTVPSHPLGQAGYFSEQPQSSIGVASTYQSAAKPCCIKLGTIALLRTC
jgi:hypothetical protein